MRHRDLHDFTTHVASPALLLPRCGSARSPRLSRGRASCAEAPKGKPNWSSKEVPLPVGGEAGLQRQRGAPRAAKGEDGGRQSYRRLCLGEGRKAIEQTELQPARGIWLAYA